MIVTQITETNVFSRQKLTDLIHLVSLCLTAVTVKLVQVLTSTWTTRTEGTTRKYLLFYATSSTWL
jgi:hypothetical protein